jgi:hypothetical protein
MHRTLLALGAGAALAACAAAVAPAPPSAAPSLNVETMIEGKRVSVGARGARALQEFGFTTRRFGSDSTWGYRSQSRTSARLRYAQSSSDSTRVLIELWLPCGTGFGCGRSDAMRLVARLQQPEASPEQDIQ